MTADDPASSPDSLSAMPPARMARGPKTRRLLSNRKTRSIIAAAMLSPMIGLFVGLATSSAASAAQVAPASSAGASPQSGGGDPTLAQVQPQAEPLERSGGQRLVPLSAVRRPPVVLSYVGTGGRLRKRVERARETVQPRATASGCARSGRPNG